MTKPRARKRPSFTVTLTDKELNYLDAGLRDSIAALESSGLAKAGNLPHLIWFSKRLRGKLRRIHYPPSGKPRLTKQVKAFIREARKQATDAD